MWMALLLILFHIKQEKESESGDADHAWELTYKTTEGIYEKENIIEKTVLNTVKVVALNHVRKDAPKKGMTDNLKKNK